jgi:hypothetical protein
MIYKLTIEENQIVRVERINESEKPQAEAVWTRNVDTNIIDGGTVIIEANSQPEAIEKAIENMDQIVKQSR